MEQGSPEGAEVFSMDNTILGELGEQLFQEGKRLVPWRSDLFLLCNSPHPKFTNLLYSETM